MNYRRKVVTTDKRNWIETLKPKGTKSGYNGWKYIIENGHKIFGLEVAPKTSSNIQRKEGITPGTAGRRFATAPPLAPLATATTSLAFAL